MEGGKIFIGRGSSEIMADNNIRGYIASAYKSCSSVQLFKEGERERYKDRLETLELGSSRIAQYRWSYDPILDEEIHQAEIAALKTEWYD